MTVDDNRLRIPIVERDLDAVAEWLEALDLPAELDREVPLLGSPAWVAADNRTRLASLARWAGVAVMEIEPAVIATRLAAEIAAGRRADRAARKQAALAVSAGHNWSAVAQRKRSGWSR